MSNPAAIRKYCEETDFDLLARHHKGEKLDRDEFRAVCSAMASPCPYLTEDDKLDFMPNPIFDITSVQLAELIANDGFAAAGYTPEAERYLRAA